MALRGNKLKVLSLLILFLVSSCTVGTVYEFESVSDTKEIELYSDEHIVLTVQPLVGNRSLIRIFSLEDSVSVKIESIRISVNGDGQELKSRDSTVIPGARILKRNQSYELVTNYEISKLPKTIHGYFYVKIQINRNMYENTHKFSMRKRNIGYFEALQSI